MYAIWNDQAGMQELVQQSRQMPDQNFSNPSNNINRFIRTNWGADW